MLIQTTCSDGPHAGAREQRRTRYDRINARPSDGCPIRTQTCPGSNSHSNSFPFSPVPRDLSDVSLFELKEPWKLHHVNSQDLVGFRQTRLPRRVDLLRDQARKRVSSAVA